MKRGSKGEAIMSNKEDAIPYPTALKAACHAIRFRLVISKISLISNHI